jgi:Na+/H+ antiporter NhaD/arsenite permease-like protein
MNPDPSMTDIPQWLLLPFLLQLLAIATMPFLAHHWWEKNYPKVSVVLGCVVAGYYVLARGDLHRLGEAIHEYGSFIILLAALFLIAGGIHLEVKGEASPLLNVLFLVSGAALANLIGTTGASMLLIRPWIRMNKYRVTGFHIVFFIFLVSNVGGALTPIGDPPLFLGYLKGVPFFWTLQHQFLPWLLVMGVMVGIFFLIDRKNFHRAPRAIREEATTGRGFSFSGIGNFAALGAVIAAVFLPSPWREFVMAAAALGSWYLTPREIHQQNDFSFAPIREVAWLFLGIFMTMIPALDLLGRMAPALAQDFGLKEPHFYYATGALSAFLDNAPTYLAFLSVDAGLKGRLLENPEDIRWIALHAPGNLIAISLGAVFFGAMTYIGNGPNFMVRSIAEEAGVKCPGFFGYLTRYSLPILLPVLVLAGWIFLR